MTTTLTQRYIAATVEGLPEDLRSEVRSELEASIADAIEGRVAEGQDRETAERVVLTELGDPAVLAAGYADRPLQLIGPKYYVAWSRLLKRLLLLVPAIVLVVVAFAQALAGATIGEVIAEAILATIQTALHVCFWVTLVFAVLERTGTDLGVSWDLDQLPEPRSTRASRADLVGSLVFLGLATGAILWDQWVGFVVVLDDRIPVLNPELWPWAMAALLGLILLEMLFAVLLYVRGGWGPLLAVVNTALAVAFFSWVVTLLTRGELFSAEFIGLAQDNGLSNDTLYVVGMVIGFSAAAIAIGDTTDGWVKTYRARSAGVEQQPATT